MDYTEDEICSLISGGILEGVTPITADVFETDSYILKFLNEMNANTEQEVSLFLSQYESGYFPTIYSSGQCGDNFYLVMSKGGRTLTSYLSGEEDLPVPLSEVMSQVEDALAILDSYGILHGDLHSDNVLIDESGIMIIDFGLSSYMFENDERFNDISMLLHDMSMSAFPSVIRAHPEIQWNREGLSENEQIDADLMRDIDAMSNITGNWNRDLLLITVGENEEVAAGIIDYLRSY